MILGSGVGVGLRALVGNGVIVGVGASGVKVCVGWGVAVGGVGVLVAIFPAVFEHPIKYKPSSAATIIQNLTLFILFLPPPLVDNLYKNYRG